MWQELLQTWKKLCLFTRKKLRATDPKWLPTTWTRRFLPENSLAFEWTIFSTETYMGSMRNIELDRGLFQSRHLEKSSSASAKQAVLFQTKVSHSILVRGRPDRRKEGWGRSWLQSHCTRGLRREEDQMNNCSLFPQTWNFPGLCKGKSEWEAKKSLLSSHSSVWHHMLYEAKTIRAPAAWWWIKLSCWSCSQRIHSPRFHSWKAVRYVIWAWRHWLHEQSLPRSVVLTRARYQWQNFITTDWYLFWQQNWFRFWQ